MNERPSFYHYQFDEFPGRWMTEEEYIDEMRPPETEMPAPEGPVERVAWHPSRRPHVVVWDRNGVRHNVPERRGGGPPVGVKGQTDLDGV